MKKNIIHLFNFLIVFVALILSIYGCAKPRVIVANYYVPPKNLESFEKYKNIHLKKADLSITGNLKSQKILAMYENYITERLAAQLYQERYYNINDDIYQNPENIAIVDSLVRNMGYEKIHSGSNEYDALIIIKGNINIEKNSGSDMISKTLVHQPYDIYYEKNKKGYMIPYSKPNKKARHETISKTEVRYEKIIAHADINVSFVDKQGNVIYNRNFTNLSYNKKIGGNADICSIPAHIEIADKLLNPTIQKIVVDISPNLQQQEIKLNEAAKNQSAIVLMKAAAFAEAEIVLNKFVEDSKKELQSLEKQYESKKADLTKNTSADKLESLLENLKKAHEQEVAERKRLLSPDYENYGLILEALGEPLSALDYLDKSCQFDDQNLTAKSAMTRISQTLAKIEQSKGLKEIDVKHEYKQDKFKTH